MSENKNSQSKRDYQVGRGKPPVHTRFKKGQSGNPRGPRPKNLPALLVEALNEKVTVTIDGERRAGGGARYPTLHAGTFEGSVNGLRLCPPNAITRQVCYVRSAMMSLLRKTQTCFRVPIWLRRRDSSPCRTRLWPLMSAASCSR
jgi:hypothetical protein